MHMQRVSIIIVNWNTGTLLAACLQSIAALPEKDVIRHVVVVDNASKDTSIDQATLVADKHTFILLPQQKNLGFSKANNVAWEYIKQHDGADDHILLLNPDTEVRWGAIQAMLDALNRNPKVGIVGPKLLDASRQTQHSVRPFPSLSILMLLFLKMHLLFLNSSFWKTYMGSTINYTKEQTVDQVMGAAFLIRNSVLRQIGLLDEAFWIWFEEVDYCKRAKVAGWDTLYIPSAIVTHYGGVSFAQKVGIAKTKPLLDSALVYARKHLGLFSYGILMLLYPVALLIAFAASFAHMQQKVKNISRL